jgi:hypothetical protein
MNGPKKLSATSAAKPLCFVIGPIGKDGTSERKHSDLILNALIKHVLLQAEFGYEVRRADEDADPGMIGDRVVTDIINADLVVADLTDLNPNAFYELGIRHSTERPTIHVARLATQLPFDNVSHRTIFVDLSDWHSIESARSRLAESIRAIKKSDYKVSNPITQANASFKMRQSEDPRDRVLAGIQERLSSLERATTRASSDYDHPDYSEEDKEAFRLLDRIAEKGRDCASRGMTIRQIEREVRKFSRAIGVVLKQVSLHPNGMLSLRTSAGRGVGRDIGEVMTDSASRQESDA